MKIGSGRYVDVISQQFSQGGPRGNKEAEAKIDTPEFRISQWVKYIKTLGVNDIRTEVIVKMAEDDPVLKQRIDDLSLELISKKAERIATNVLAEEPLQTLVEQRINTHDFQVQQWTRFLQEEQMEEINKEAAASIYGSDPPLDIRIDELTEESIYSKAKEKASRTEVTQQIEASRAAILSVW